MTLISQREVPKPVAGNKKVAAAAKEKPLASQGACWGYLLNLPDTTVM